MSDRLPAGIFYRQGERAPDFFRLVTFNFRKETSRTQAYEAVKTLWDVLADLQKGIVRDLLPARPADPEIRVKADGLVPTLCFGTRLFRSGTHDQLLARPAPTDFPMLGQLPFNGLQWGPTARPNAAQTDFAITLHGGSELSVARAVVELQKAIDDHALPVTMVCFYSGLHRDDGRSWIDFHDGINNLKSGDERKLAIEVKQNAADWLIGGSTMLFLKIEIDLQGWRRLPRELQEALVGRDKLTGCPLESVTVDSEGKLSGTISTGCPMTGTLPADSRYVTVPTQAHNHILQASHIHRTNRQRSGPDQMTANRIFRQGYEFVDSPPEGGVRVGLNFVSFQNDFDRVRGILTTAHWLRDANFGGIEGDAAVPAFKLMSIVAGGYFLVPPTGNPFPGAEVFTA